MFSSGPILWTSISAVILSLYLIIREIFRPIDQKWSTKYFSSKKYKLPTGPAGVPVLGNLPQFMKARQTGQLFPWLGSMRQYGDMTTLHLGSETWVLLNSKKAAEFVIQKNGRITNERPEMPIASGLVSHSKRTVIRQAKEWAEGRRVMHHLLSGSVLKTYGTWQEFASLQLLSSYLEDPGRWYAHHFRYSLAVLYRVVMGDDLAKSKAELDEFQQTGMEFVKSLAQSPVDFFPVLSKLPKFLQPWREFWAAMGNRHRNVMVNWWTPTYAQVQAGTAKPSFVRDTLLHPDVKYKGNEEEAMYLAVSVMTAGGDNTRMSLNTFIMSMIANPDCFATARAELDTICISPNSNSLRLPGIQDIDNLPYISAIIKEVLRWRPTVPIVPPHQSTEDFTYEGYTFPAGVSFVINNVAISQEHEDWDTFDPTRWIDGNQTNVIHNHWGFGGGRRVCVGYRIAQQALFIAIARLVFCFDIVPSGDFNTKVLNHVSLVEPFPVKVSPRSKAHEELIKELFAAELKRQQEANERA